MNKERVVMFCEICDNEAKYCCPGCNTRTCSVGCVNTHKVQRDCDGRKCKTAYVSVSEFSDNHLLSDYKFLEELGSYVDSTRRDGVLRQRYKKGLNLAKLKSACRRRNISFLYQESIMTKRLQNTTSYNHKKDMILWRVEWIFHQANNAHYTDPRVCEDTPLKVLLEKYLHPTESDPVIRHKLQKYVMCGGVDCVEVFMKVQWKQLKGTRYYRMDLTRSLRENLSHKMVIEFPTLHVSTSQTSSSFILYDPSTDAVMSHTRISKDVNMDMPDEHTSLHDNSEEETCVLLPSCAQSTVMCSDTNLVLPTVEQPHSDTTRDESVPTCSTSEMTNGLELLIGQYDSSDNNELEPGEVM